ncbi:MAG TPA: hypothetical protein VJ877_06070, partial [Bacteroidales bacterium]|nr:hypothetical protein [Bacteroidales bacterium]
LQHQIDFYRTALENAREEEIKAYVFSTPPDKSRNARFIQNLLQHQVRVYRPKKDIVCNGKVFKAENSFVVPMAQKEYYYVKSMFEKITEFEENVFYDISTWILPLSFNIDYAEYKGRMDDDLLGPEVIYPPYPEGSLRGERDAYAWIFEWNEYYSPGALYRILDAGINARVATEDFIYDDGDLRKNFKRGTIMVPAYNQEPGRDEIYELMKEIVGEFAVTIYGMKTGYTPEGIDLGSNSFDVLDKPSVMMFVGDGISSRDAGEVWHMFDQRFAMPVTMVDVDESRVNDLSEYNVIVIAGSPSLSESELEELKRWNRRGGVIIAYKRGNSFIDRAGLVDIEYIPSASVSAEDVKYGDRYSQYSVHRIPGSIFNVKIDNTHPLFYGYMKDHIPVFKSGSGAVVKSSSPFSNPAVYDNNPLISGYCSKENEERIAGSAFCTVHSSGRGNIISFYDNTNFRAIWYGTSRIFMNAVMFGQIF